MKDVQHSFGDLYGDFGGEWQPVADLVKNALLRVHCDMDILTDAQAVRLAQILLRELPAVMPTTK